MNDESQGMQLSEGLDIERVGGNLGKLEVG